ncbi:MAG: bifunctional DNA-formamidopyrimidine glycosylase/DNA-(apurinic or apyrimidinic site) lyase [Bdellovibrio sp.]|nr:bifunctional DNA-formamidopyrimidine glycosylase/DNA-(apurinic or apyrimidinic site) lyase [Bdellovibrio sp.]
MPELPEVEIVCRNLNEILKPPFQIASWQFFRKDLRFKIPQKELLQLLNKDILAIQRRAKYILFETADAVIVSHLGMTGSWRVESKDWNKRKHDHVAFEFKTDLFLIYEDARRFGFIEFFKKSEVHQRFADLGPEPLAKETDFDQLTKNFKKLSSPIKIALMNQKFLVGVGNIYASEVLFRSGVSPLKKCSNVTAEQYKLIWKWTKKILESAIEKGGSTIENYRNSFGESGGYQASFFVYGRKGQLCIKCNTPVRSLVQGGRTTFWCKTCQK